MSSGIRGEAANGGAAFDGRLEGVFAVLGPKLWNHIPARLTLKQDLDSRQ